MAENGLKQDSGPRPDGRTPQSSPHAPFQATERPPTPLSTCVEALPLTGRLRLPPGRHFRRPSGPPPPLSPRGRAPGARAHLEPRPQCSGASTVGANGRARARGPALPRARMHGACPAGSALSRGGGEAPAPAAAAAGRWRAVPRPPRPVWCRVWPPSARGREAMLARLLRRRGKALAACESFGVFHLSFKDNAESHSLVVCVSG